MRLRSLLARVPFVPILRLSPVVAVVRLGGVVGGIGPLRRGLTLAGVERTLERAFALDGLEGVALAVNSPGGSAVQSALIHDRIRALAAERGVPVFAFAEDVAASGGYWLALAGDEIHADESSIIGSIGVISAGFGFTQAIARLGVERRIHTAGHRKSMLDPFRPEDADEVARLEAIQGEIHEIFIAAVRRRRRGRLKGDDETLFSGDFWTGRRALELGLVDGLGDLRSVMRSRFGDGVKLKRVDDGGGWIRRRFRLGGGASPSEWTDGVLAAVEARAWWGRYGL